ncbi:glycosyltransferase [Enterococcus eurekensis]|uniref:Glycosyltransferase n=1 Tax=Enterococcus eurekensis TaxID=1159753 RepID=A0ABV9M4B3_9ENTE
MIQNSFKTIISSEGFKKFLPKDVSYQLVHNISNMGDRQIEYENPLEKENIVIGFVGNVRYEEENIKLIKIFKEDKRFKFGYWGNVNSGFTPKEIIKNNENVHFHGKFSNVDKPLIYNNVSFINAIYGNDGLEVTTALPNRLYDALIFKKPILTSKGTFLGEIVEKNGIGIAIDFNENDVYESIILYVENFNYIEFQKKCDSLLDIYLEEQHRFEQKICSFIE